MPESYKDIEDRISKACDAYNQREKPKIKALAREFDVPYKRLLARINGRQSRSTRPSTNKALDEAQEKALIQWITLLDNSYASPTPSMVEQCANAILSRNGGGATVGPNWVYRFIKRLPPEFNLMKQKPIERKRFEAENISLIQAWYDRLDIQINTHAIRPKNIYNFDESGFQIGQGKDQNVITTNPTATAYIPTGGLAESVTIIECIAADGWLMAPFLLLPGQWHMENWYRQSTLPDDYRIAPTPKGWTSDSIAYDWLHFFNECTKSRVSRGEYRLLLMDGHGSHLTHEFLQFCDTHRIIAFCFPPHTTHLLQPLDGKPFQAYKHYYRKNNNAVVQWGGSVSQKSDFLREIHGIRMQTFKDRTIRHSFAERGIYPFQPKLVVDSLKKAKEPTPELRIHGETPPPPSSSPTSSPPTTISKLRQSINKAQNALQDLTEDLNTLNPKLTPRLQRIFQGSLIQAELSAQQGEDLSRVLRNREHLHAKKTRRQVKAIGALSVKDANRRIEAREVEETEKEWRRIRRTVRSQTNIQQPHTTLESPLGNLPSREASMGAEERPQDLFYIDTVGRPW
jgi:hypothetical protein